MLQIPKNVMQIGETNPHTKIYMEDYVHTFLEHETGAETYLVFGKKEERDDVFYYMIYGVEKKTDWDRGSFPYFKKLERIGTLEGTQQSRVFRPVRGAGMPLDGYFIFYEQNEDMQSYMIAAREAAASLGTAGCEEKEEVLEAVRQRRERNRKQEASSPERPSYRRDADGTHRHTLLPAFASEKRQWSIYDLCRAGSLVLLVLLVALGLTSINRYPDMKAVTGLFSDAANAVAQRQAAGKNADAAENAAAGTGAEEAAVLQQETGMIVEEESLTAETAGAGQIEWTIGDSAKESETAAADKAAAETADAAVSKQPPAEAPEAAEASDKPETSEAAEASDKSEASEAARAEATDTENPPIGTTHADRQEALADTAQALARPVSYIVKRGDSLAGIARKFYGSASMVKEICKVNEIDDPDQIHAGQNILLP